VAWVAPVQALRDGGYRLRLDDAERRLVRDLCDELRQHIERDDPAVARLFPAAYRDDAEANEEWERLVREGLVDGRLTAIHRVESTMRAEELDEEDAAAWCGALNDIRLVLGERLGVTEETDVEWLAARDASYAIYAWLTWLQANFVDALASRL
jgi:hypothetical protein